MGQVADKEYGEFTFRRDKSYSADYTPTDGSPPPLPARRRKLPPDGALRRSVGYKSKPRHSLPTSTAELPMVTSRSPSARKRDAMQRRHNSTSAISLSCDLSQAGIRKFSCNTNSTESCSSDSPRVLMDDDCACDYSVVGYPESLGGRDVHQYSPGDVFPGGSVWPSYTNECSDESLDKVDIVGESFDARYPWQRDVSTQCSISTNVAPSRCRSIRTSSNSTESSQCPNSPPISPSSIQRKIHTFRNVRPHSIGCMDNIVYEAELKRIREQNGRRVRNSEPYIHDNALAHRKRLLNVDADDPGSVSDLESILENPGEGSLDVSRNNSVISEDGSSADELPLLTGPRGNSYLDVLPSPCVSPEIWHNSVPDVIVNADDEAKYAAGVHDMFSAAGGMQLLSVPRKPVRRRSSGSITSGSEESDCEPSPPVVRRGRRAAIVDTKNVGDVSPTTMSPDVSPSNSCDEGDGSNIACRLRRRRSSVDLAMSIYPGDLLVQEHHKKLIKRNTISDFYASRNGSSPVLNDDSKKARQPFSLLKLMKTRSKESLSHLGDLLNKMKPSEFKDNHLAAYKNVHWTDLIASTDKQTASPEVLDIPEVERKRRESVWELFKSECVFLIDHLMVLKNCYLEPLKKVQVEGFLMYAEPSDIFSNIDELCYVSYTFCKDFIGGLVKDMSATDFGRTSVLIKAFQRFSTHSKDGSVYHTYCLNYTNALNYLEKLRKNDDFCEFEKWCEQDPRCNRLQLADLLIGPMQHCTKLPLLLHNIKKYTEDGTDKQQIVDSIEKVESSLKQLEDKMKWLKNFERVQEIQRHLVWPSVTDLDKGVFIPEYLKSKLLRQPCERLLACPRRQILLEGPITLTESTKPHDAYLFLFGDILLITKIKKPNRKKLLASDVNHGTGQPTDKQTYSVHRQPIALDRFGLHDLSASEATANGLKFAFVIVQISRFQQILDVFTLQASNEVTKNNWMLHIKDAKNRYCQERLSRQNSTKDSDTTETNNNNREGEKTSGRRISASSIKKIPHTKSHSVDGIFL